MPELGRWGIHDPLSGTTLEPYGYAYNNPIFFNDPTGMIGEPGEPELAPNAPGGKNNPIEIPEVVLTKKSKSININNFGLYNPNSLNFGQWVQYQQASQRYQKVIEFLQSRANCGYCHDRGVMMIGGAGDPIGILDVGALLLSRMSQRINMPQWELV